MNNKNKGERAKEKEGGRGKRKAESGGVGDDRKGIERGREGDGVDGKKQVWEG
jgi:hypothetical protein